MAVGYRDWLGPHGAMSSTMMRLFNTALRYQFVGFRAQFMQNSRVLF